MLLMICGMTSQASSTINRIATRYASKMATHRQRLEYFNSLAWKKRTIGSRIYAMTIPPKNGDKMPISAPNPPRKYPRLFSSR